MKTMELGMVWYGMVWYDMDGMIKLLGSLYLDLRGHGTKLNMDSNVLCLDAAAPATPTTMNLLGLLGRSFHYGTVRPF